MAQVKDLLVKGQAKFLRKVYFQDQIVSNVAQGTAPLVVASSTVVSNLNSDYLDGYHASGLFTALSANSTLSITIGGTTLTSSINAATVDGKYISNYYTKSEADDRFVNVAGDTMSGALTVKQYIFGYNYNHAGANAPAFVFDKPGSNYTGIGANGEADTIYFSAATFSNGEASWVTSYKQKWKFNGTIYQENNAVIHSGNIGSQSVSYASSAGNADTVDNLHASNLVKFYLSPMTGGAPADSATSWFVNTMPSGTGAIVYNVPGSEKTIIAGKSTGAYGHMLQLNYDDNYLRILRYYAGKWKTSDWEKISAGYADAAGNAATATNADTLDGYHASSFSKTKIIDLPVGQVLRINVSDWNRGLLISMQGRNGGRNALYFVTGYGNGTTIRNDIRVIKGGPYNLYFNGTSEAGCVYIVGTSTNTAANDYIYINPFDYNDITYTIVSSVPSDAVLVSSSNSNILATLDSNVASSSKWATPRTITLTGSVTGSVSIDGSQNVSLATTTNHTHNYAGSSSAGGSANSALTLLYNNKFDTTYGDYAIFQQKYNISDFPHNGWFNSIKMLHNNSYGYFTEIATSFTGEDGMWRRALRNGAQVGWYKILDSGNYNSYALPLSGGTVTGQLYLTGLAEGASDVTDNTEILTSYASNNGFADSNGLVHRRDAIHLYNYVKSKLDSVYLPLSGGTMSNTNVVTNLNADLLDGYNASSFAKVASANNLISFGNEFNFVPSAFAGEVHINYRTTGGTNGAITKYNFDNGAGGLLASISQGQFSGNAATATNADTLDGYHATMSSSTPWGTIPVITPQGWMDVGKHFEFHYDNTTGSDYSTLLTCTGNYGNIVSLPSTSGTLALTTDNVASSTQSLLLSNTSDAKAALGVYFHRDNGITSLVGNTEGNGVWGHPSDSQDSRYGNASILRIGWYISYYTDIFTGPNDAKGKYGLQWRQIVNGTAKDWRTILDSSNYNYYCPKLDGTGATGTWGISITGNAAKANLLSVTRFAAFDVDTPTTLVMADYGSGFTITNRPSWFTYGGIFTINTSNDLNGTLNCQLGWDVQHNTSNAGLLYFRSKDEITGWREWTKICTEQSGNAVSATKLQNSRTIWGQSFDGTGNVDGNIISTLTDLRLYYNTNKLFLQAAPTGIFLGEGTAGTTYLSLFGKYIRIYIGSSEKMRISDSGNVGIGTTSPSYKLHVVGDIYTTTGFKKEGSSDSYVLLGGGGHKPLSEFFTVSTTSGSSVASLYCGSYSAIYIARSSSQTMSFASTPAEGKECHIVIYNSGSSNITITLPSSYRKNITSITIAPQAFGEVNVMTINSIVHVRAV